MNHPTPNQMAALVDGTLWVADDGSWRIYMESRRDATVYFKMDDFSNAALVISINDCNQSANWYASQKKRLAERYMTAGVALAFAHSSMAAAEAIMLEEVPERVRQWRSMMTAEVIDEAMGHLANGRTAEALAAIGYEVADV